MAGYPSMDQYNDAVQYPNTAFSDVVLKSAKIATNGMSLPIALGGGFALTYTAVGQGKKFAVRCFHKEARGLETRYALIDKDLRVAGGLYFVGFEYQPAGILVNGKRFPIVKMDWVDGDTLGSFLENNFSDKVQMDRLRQQFIDLEKFLRSKRIAHGDLQNGNVLVRSDIKLIDYDGMYVPSLPTGQGMELGHKHFQHPKRSAADFGPDVDRFSFIVIDLSLRAVAHNPKLFSRYSSGENIIFTANDFIDPNGSPAFSDLKAISVLARDTASLANICAAPLKSVPTLGDFLAGNNIPAAAIIVRTPTEAKTPKKEATYIGAYDVVDASDYLSAAKQVGNRVEFVGIVTNVHTAKTKYDKPYCFVFFGGTRQSVKLNIWSEGLAKLSAKPTQAWVGTWLSVQGLVNPPYPGRHGVSLSITVASSSQLRKITEAEARHRLKNTSSKGTAADGNRVILETLSREGQVASRLPAMHVSQTNQSRNQAILASVNQVQTPSWKSATPPPSPQGKVPWAWIVFGAAVVLFLILREVLH